MDSVKSQLRTLAKTNVKTNELRAQIKKLLKSVKVTDDERAELVKTRESLRANVNLLEQITEKLKGEYSQQAKDVFAQQISTCDQGHVPLEIFDEGVTGIDLRRTCPVCEIETMSSCRCFLMEVMCENGHVWFECKACQHLNWWFKKDDFQRCKTWGQKFTDKCSYHKLPCLNPECSTKGRILNGNDIIKWKCK